MASTMVAFDTLAYVRRLRATGVDGEQAEAHAEAMRDALTDGVATKTDVADLRADLYRALWLQAGGIVAAIAALAGIAFALANFIAGAGGS